MRSIESWFSEYNESHQNEKNKAIHFFCVPAIFLTVVTLGMEVRIPGLNHEQTFINALYSLSGIVILGGLIFYFNLSKVIFFLMVPLIALCVFIGIKLQQHDLNIVVSLSIFALAWVGQFVGHKIEGKKPKFIQDLQFLLIGPAWCLSFMLDKLNIKY